MGYLKRKIQVTIKTWDIFTTVSSAYVERKSKQQYSSV